MKKHILLSGLLTLFAYGNVFSSDGFTGESKPAKSAVHKYVKEHIMPVLLQKRQELDNELTPAERDEIAQCRATLKRIHEQMREFMQQKPEGMSMRDYAEQSGQNPHWEMHKQTKAVMEQLEAIAAKHSNTLDKFKTDLAPAVKQWKEDIARLVPQNKDGEQPYHQYYMGENAMMHGLNGEHALARFLLLRANSADNADDLFDAPDGELKSETIAPATTNTNITASISAFQVTPNPATNEIVTGNIPLPDGNELVVYDMQGKAVITLLNVQPSQHIDVSNLANGTYLIQLRSGDQQENRKVVVSH